MRRFLLRAGGAILLVAQMQSFALAEYPNKPVRIVVPAAAGGGVDVMARLIAQQLNEMTGQKFYVENRPGAAGVIGSNLVIGSPPDGYNLLFTPSSLSLAVAVRKTPPYNITKDFTPIIEVSITPYVLAANGVLPVKTVQDLITYAKANPSALSYSSAGIGSASHLAAELFKSMTGIQMVHVPNKGVSPAIVDLISGQVQVMFAGLPAIQGQKASGQFRLLGLAEAKRSPLVPDLPTISEQGFPGFETKNWVGLLGPTGLDRAIAAKLHADVVRIVDVPAVRERMKTLGYDVVAGTPQQFGEQMSADVKRWSAVIEAAQIPRN